MRDYREILDHAAKVVEEMDAEQYPYLWRFFHKPGSKRTMLGLIEIMESYERPMWLSASGEAWFAIAQGFMIDKYGGSAGTWHSRLIALTTFGLLKRIKPGNDSRVEAFFQLYVKAIKAGKQPEMVYCIPEYTPELLEAAEAIAKQWSDSGVSYSHVSKSSVITATSQQNASRIYVDSRKKTRQQIDIEHDLVFRMKKTIANRGYITKAELLAEASHRNFYEAVLRVWQSLHDHLLQEANARYHAPTKAEREQYHLTDGAWIITSLD